MKLYLLITAIIANIFFFKKTIENKDDKIANPLMGKWQVTSFEYKYANDPKKDYMASRNDFENMVKAKCTYEFYSDSSAAQTLGEFVQEYVYEIKGDHLFLYPCANQKIKRTCVLLSKKDRDFGDYKINFGSNSLTFSQSNEVFILKINLNKIN